MLDLIIEQSKTTQHYVYIYILAKIYQKRLIIINLMEE